MASKQKVLIVDDEPRNQRIVTETLEDLFELQVASSGEEALQCLEKDPPDLVLLDIMMPGMSGYEVCAHVRNNPDLRFTKVILVSGKAMIDERLKGYEAGADDYMTKPFVPEELMAKSKVFLRLAHIEKELDQMNHSLDAKVQEKARLLMAAEMKLVNSAKMSALGEMAGGVAHEINTPLATILLLSDQQTEVLAEKENAISKESLENYFSVIATAAKHIAKIVQGLRFFSRDSSADPFAKADLAKIVEDTILLCAERFKTHSVRLDVQSLQLSISCRSVEIAQVLLNLLNNSFQAIEKLPDKWVQILVQEDREFVEISVTDSGSGIPPVTREKIFQPFYTTKDVGQGTGLGLSISKGIIENHNGTLKLDETSANTRFVIRIPKEQNALQVAG